MARTIPSEKRRIKQVKVNLSVSELNELDKYVAENGSDRSTILRDSFEQFLKLKTSFWELFPAMFMVLGVSYFALCVQNVVFPILEPLGVDFDLSSGPPITFINLIFTTRKRTFLIKHHFECKESLEGALGSPLTSILVSFGEFLGAPFGVFAGYRGHPEFPKLFILAPLNPHVFASTILAPKHEISRNRVFTVVKLHFLKMRERMNPARPQLGFPL